MEVRLVILSPSGSHRTVVRRLPLPVGRSEESRLRIAQDCVSRRHCEIVERDGAVFVRDLKSTNGTLVDGVAIEPEADVAVPSGSVIKVGAAAFRVEYGTGGTTVAAAEPVAATDEETVPLDGADPAAAAADSGAADPAWPMANPPQADDSDLNEFFKSLS